MGSAVEAPGLQSTGSVTLWRVVSSQARDGTSDPELQGGLLATRPPGNSRIFIFNQMILSLHCFIHLLIYPTDTLLSIYYLPVTL